jgi:hypothetical protein
MQVEALSDRLLVLFREAQLDLGRILAAEGGLAEVRHTTTGTQPRAPAAALKCATKKSDATQLTLQVPACGVCGLNRRTGGSNATQQMQPGVAH